MIIGSLFVDVSINDVSNKKDDENRDPMTNDESPPQQPHV